MITNGATSPGSKHIAVKYHFVQEKYERNQLDVRFCGTKDMVADLLTKLLNGPSHRRLCDMLFRAQLEGEY